MSELTLWCLLVNNAGDRVGTAFEVMIASSSNVAGLARNFVTGETGLAKWMVPAIWKPTDDLPNDNNLSKTVRGWRLNPDEVNDMATLLSPAMKLGKVFDQGLAEKLSSYSCKMGTVLLKFLLPACWLPTGKYRKLRSPPADSLALNGIIEHIGRQFVVLNHTKSPAFTPCFGILASHFKGGTTFFSNRPGHFNSLLYLNLMIMLVRKCSRSDGYDCYRMLLQAACLVHLSNALRHTNKDQFIITAIYIDSEFLATRYLVWQPENHGTDLYNLAACANMQGKCLPRKNRIKLATQRLDHPSIRAYIRQKNHKRGRGDDDKNDDGQRSPKRSKNNGGAKESMTWMTWMDEVIVDAGYEVVGGNLGSLLPLSESMREGWSPSHRSFVFKLVGRESDELEILKYLKKHRGSEHHLIELHGVISDGLDDIIVLPRLTPLSDALRRLDKSALATVPQQFLEGVGFMHRHKVAHLDLKTDNIVIEQSGPSGRLTAYIIDFDCSMMVEGVETTIKDMYGTPGWMAPEVSATRSYSPILADRWACGNVLLQLGNHLKLSVELKKLSRELMCTDPRSRPVLPRSGIVPPAKHKQSGPCTRSMSRAPRPMCNFSATPFHAPPYAHAPPRKLQAGALSQSSSRYEADFALWKASKAGEPSWPSVWGPGRPGWHIECSVMASEVLGENMDIHSGGSDLAFPHHDNEIAQSEAIGAQWVNYFLHTGHLHIEGLKMSKSLKNFITIDEILRKYTARQLRLAFLLVLWNAKVDFHDSTMKGEVRTLETTFDNFFAIVKALGAQAAANHKYRSVYKGPERNLGDALTHAQATFRVALCDSFNTPQALDVLSKLVSRANVYITQASGKANVGVLESIAQWVGKMLRMFGLGEGPQVEGMLGWGESRPEGETTSVDREEILMPYLRTFSSFRDNIRGLAMTQAPPNQFRDTDMVPLGVALDDQEDGRALVKLVPAATLMRLRDEKNAAAEAKMAKKAAATEAEREERRAKLEKGKAPPELMFKPPYTEQGVYGSWDDKGIPLTDGEGAEVTKSQRKKLINKQETQQKLHTEWKAWRQEEGGN
ncbi:tRNA synthetases class I (C) catalytic domain-containing protein [Gautieria morchelliformis]|nr:tRNA synthetases class I (C) catalytic domain-containing protein [Gautieria morchelliformis]